MARRVITLDEKINKAEIAVAAAKVKYDAALDKLEKLLAKRKQLDDRKVLDAYHNGSKTADEIVAFIRSGREGKMRTADLYDDIGEVTGSLEACEAELETIILNGKNEKANRYMREALMAIRHALSEMSDALFGIATEVSDDDFEDDEDGLDEPRIL